MMPLIKVIVEYVDDGLHRKFTSPFQMLTAHKCGLGPVLFQNLDRNVPDVNYLMLDKKRIDEI